MNVPHNLVKIDINEIKPSLVEYIQNEADNGVRVLDAMFLAQGRVIALGNGYTATATVSVNDVLITDNLSCTVDAANNLVTAEIDCKRLQLTGSGVMKVQITVSDGTNILISPQPVLIRLTPDLAQTAQILPDSHSSYSEIVAEIVAARGDYDNLAQALSHLMGFLSSETVDNATADGTIYYTDVGSSKALIIPVSGRASQVQFRLDRDGKVYARRRSRSSTSVDFPAWGAFDQIGWKRSDIEGWIEAAIESLEPEYIFVTEIPSNADHSKKYVLPDGYIWEWQEGTPGSTYNANTGIINKRPPTNDNYEAALLNQSGTLVSELIPFDASWKYSSDGSYGHLADIQISGINKIVPAYNSSVIIYYYRRDNGNPLGAVLSAQMHTLNNTPNTNDITLPVQFSLMDQDIYFSGIDTSNPGATIGYVRVMIGISKTGGITENDVKDVVINVPFYDVPATSGGWVNTGVKHPDYDHGLPDGGTAGQVLTKTADGEAWQDIDFSNALNVQSGQRLYAIGDSITYGHGIGGNNYSWVKHVIDHNGYLPYGANGSLNLGVSGLGFCTTPPGDNPTTLTKVLEDNNFSKADIVTVALGINDWKNSNATFSAFWSGMEYCFNKIRTDNPYCRIYYILPFNACYIGNQASYYCLGSIGDSGAELYSHTLLDFINMIKAKFEEPTFKAFNVNVIDLTECPELNRRNITTALYDRLHPSAATNVKLGQDIARRIIPS